MYILSDKDIKEIKEMVRSVASDSVAETVCDNIFNKRRVNTKSINLESGSYNGIITLYNLGECPHCGNLFFFTVVPQTPGFRDTENLICPYCKEIASTSMEWEFTSEKLS